MKIELELTPQQEAALNIAVTDRIRSCERSAIMWFRAKKPNHQLFYEEEVVRLTEILAMLTRGGK